MVVYPFNVAFTPMKPSKIDDNNPKDVERLHQIFNSSEFVAEEKIDGCHYTNINGRFFSTHISAQTGWPVEKTENFPHIVEALRDLGSRFVLDGEIYYPGGKSQNVTSVTGTPYGDKAVQYQKENGFVHFMMFDVLRDLDGKWLLDQTMEQRRKSIEKVYAELQGFEYLHINPWIMDNKEQYFKKLIAEGREGVVLKKLTGQYLPGTKPKWNWVKRKQSDTDDVVIMGFAEATKKYTGKDLDNHPYWIDDTPVTKYFYLGWIGSIRYGKYNEQGKLIELGKCSGIDEGLRENMTKHPDKYIGQVMKIKIMEKTDAGNNRHANFAGIHTDKNPEECIIGE